MNALVKLASQEDTTDVGVQTTRASLSGLLRRLFAALEEKQVNYCLLRDGDDFARLAQSKEIDLLVDEVHLPRLRSVAAEQGFLRLPAWGHSPHHFFLIYDEERDRWLKLDVVTRITYGRPIRTLHTELALSCLQRRKRRGPTYVLSAEDEFVTLLLHCVLDKGRFDPARRRRLEQLRHEVTEHEYLSSQLASNGWSDLTWTQMVNLIDGGDWHALLSQESIVAARLARRDRFATVFRRLRGRLLQKLNRWAGFWRRRVPMVALLAPDGAGKTTLAAGIEAVSYFPTRTIYMGLYQNEKSRPRYLSVPGLGLLSRLLTQWRRYLTARYHQGRSRLVIFDRYTYDAALSSRRSLDPLRKFRRWLLANACPPPELVIILDAPGTVLYARKGEHTVDVLEQQRQEYLQMRSELPRAVVIDVSQDSDAVRREAMSLIWRQMRKQAIRKGGKQ